MYVKIRTLSRVRILFLCVFACNFVLFVYYCLLFYVFLLRLLVFGIPRGIELAPYVGMRLAVEIVGKVMKFLLGIEGALGNLAVVRSVGVSAEVVPSVTPSAVGKLGVSLGKSREYLPCGITAGKVTSGGSAYDRVEYDIDLFIYIQLYEKSLIPIRRFDLIVNEIKITLTVKNMRALILLVAADAVTVLGKHDVRAAMHHFVRHIVYTG